MAHRRLSKPKTKGKCKLKRILVAVPVLNEAESLGAVIDGIKSVKIPGAKISTLILDDGSIDDSVKIARGRAVEVISHGKNRGLGATFRSAVRYAQAKDADILVTIDGDGQFDPQDIPKLVAPVAHGQADFVTASRFRNDAYTPKMSRVKLWGNRRVAWLVNTLAGTNLHDVSCGFRAYSKEALLSLDLIGDYTYTHETILTMAFQNLALTEVDVHVRGERQFGESRVAKSVFWYAVNTGIIILRNFRDYKPLVTFGAPAVLIGGVGLLCLLYFGISSLILQEFYPKILAFVGAFLVLFATLLLITALMADMFTRIRKQLENVRRMLAKF
jgi:glycosyltransferase involved in cell wall biosynthesis